MRPTGSPATAEFRAARDSLIRHREDYQEAKRCFGWPRPAEFNWAFDWFDVVAAEHPDRTALWIVGDEPDVRVSYARLSARSDQVARWLRDLGVRRGDVLLTLLGNVVPLWELVLAAAKLGVVIIPAMTTLDADEIADHVVRGRVRHVVAASALCDRFDRAGAPRAAEADPDLSRRFREVTAELTRIAVGDEVPGWHDYAASATAPASFEPDGATPADAPLLRYFTSGTTARPKVVEHSHVSYTVGHLSTMYWTGLRPGDVHLTVSSPGSGRQGWRNASAFAQWNAGATALVLDHERFSVEGLFDVIARCGVTTFCAPPTVWRLIIQADLKAADVGGLRECVSAGEPLNPEVIARVRAAWGITVRDGYGQTETTAQIGNTPGQPVKPGSMGRALPGYSVALLDETTGAPGTSGEICLPLDRSRPLGLMIGFGDDPAKTAAVMRDGYYHSGDIATVDDEGYFTYIGRADDVFKSSGRRISPFELENVLLEHEAVADVAVVASPDPRRQAVPKAYVTCAAGHSAGAGTARAILSHVRERLAPEQWVRRLEFAGHLPKTPTGKIRRAELRAAEARRFEVDAPPAGNGDDAGTSPRGVTEFWEEDFGERLR
ncbi:AMP-binding protein [Saccharothrix australiensis]|uniref:Acetyl-CoA synthetase n=1 Tax=Saccharothrix australiensis TaxID=2072 RepID=A0A495VWF4_9PSEU|nr:AMP-binding protein [Saccharothrix australiensis]RKT53692.1 acetyl-CoA synthetase [Saccharothrix australiensis]